MSLLVEYRILDNLKVINEGTGPSSKTKLRGVFQKCDEQNNNGRIYPRPVLENQVKAIQEKIADRSLVGALDHPPNDAIHLSQASHLITKLWVEPNGQVMGECEILSTPNGQIVKALINDGVKIGISSRGLGTVTESSKGKYVNEDFRLITFDLVSDPSTKGAYPELTESIRENSNKAQHIVSKMKNERVLLTALERKIDEALMPKEFAKKMTGAGKATGEESKFRQARLQKAAKIAAAKGLTATSRHHGHTGEDAHPRSDEYEGRGKSYSQIPPVPKGGVQADKLARDKARQARIAAKQNSSTELFKNPLTQALQERCWKGYKPVPGKEPYSKGSCKKK